MRPLNILSRGMRSKTPTPSIDKMVASGCCSVRACTACRATHRLNKNGLNQNGQYVCCSHDSPHRSSQMHHQSTNNVRYCGSKNMLETNTRRNARECARTNKSVHTTVSTKVRYARVNTYHGNIDDVQLAHCVTDKLVQHVLLFCLFLFSSFPLFPQPFVLTLHSSPLPVPRTIYIGKPLVRNPPNASRADVTRFLVYTLSDVQIDFVHHVDNIV